jgi:ComF family protein
LTLGVLLARIAVAQADPLPDALVPVPLYRGRLAERGYNQSLELAKTVAAEIGLPVLPRVCRRVRPTLAQSSLSPAARRRNVRGAFSIEPRSLPPRLAIVDDVMTSGQTVIELARVLRESGVEWIEVWCLARAVRR